MTVQYNLVMSHFLIWCLIASLTACSQPILLTPTIELTPTPQADPAELSQAELAAQIVDALVENDAGAARSLIERYQAIYGGIEPDSDALLGQLADQLAAGSPDPAELARLWLEQVLAEIEARETQYMNASSQPGEIASNRVEAFIQAHDFADAFLSADEDRRFTHQELADLAQLAANAEASLANTGDPPLIEFSRQIDQILRHTARGEWPQARQALTELKRDLPRRPDPISMNLRAKRGSLGIF